MAKIIDDAHIHDGHRARMKRKLLTHGQRIFDTYELLEMLLYQVIPYKDTNPVAKRLLASFGGLDGVLRADKTDLMQVNGVGERTADLLKATGKLSDIIGAEILPEEKNDFSSYDDVGKFFVDYFAGREEKCVVAIFLDNSMRLLSVKKLYDLEYSSAGVRAKGFLDEAVKHRATVIISAHNHPYGPFYPTQGDRATNNAITDALSAAGFIHAEHYIVSGNSYAGLGSLINFKCHLSQMPALDEFLESRARLTRSEQGVSMVSSDASLAEITLGSGSYNTNDFGYFSDLLFYGIGKNHADVASILLPKYRTIENVLTASAREIENLVDEKCAFFLKLLAYVTSRRQTEEFTFGKAHTAVEIADYLKALFIGEPSENTYLLTYNADGNVTGCHHLGEGTVSASEILPRKAVEIAISERAESVSLAHNHPFGTPKASIDDINVTRHFESIFAGCNISFKEHFIIAGQLCNLIKSDTLINSDFRG